MVSPSRLPEVARVAARVMVSWTRVAFRPA